MYIFINNNHVTIHYCAILANIMPIAILYYKKNLKIVFCILICASESVKLPNCSEINKKLLRTMVWLLSVTNYFMTTLYCVLTVPPDERCMLKWASHWYKVPDDTPIAQTGRILLPACMSLCQQRSNCKSVAFSFNNENNNCRLYNSTRYDKPLLDSVVYSYYEHYCHGE